MKVLILIEIASLGGHALSALTSAKKLHERGHAVTFAGGKGPLLESIKKKFPFVELTYHYYCGKRQSYFTWKSLETLKQLSGLLTSNGFDHIHAFDARSYILATIVGIRRSLPVTCTLCGGITPYYNIPTCGKLIVFSQEQRDKLVKKFRWRRGRVDVISARLDIEQITRQDKENVRDLCQRYGINSEKRNIMMITNFLGPKVEAVKHVLTAVPEVLQRFPDISLVMIGARGDFYPEARRIGDTINKGLGRQGVIFTGSIINAQRLLKAAYIVLGVGRSAFEGMAHQKPTLIVGERGYAGTVAEENVDQLWYFNFSGRNNKIPVSPENLRNEVIRLIQDRRYYESVRQFGIDFLKKHIDINAGISRIEGVYKANELYARREKKWYRWLDMGRVLLPIFIDNYYNFFKSILHTTEGRGK